MADTLDLVIALSARDAASAVFRNFEGVLSELPGIVDVASGALLGIGVAAATAFGASVVQAADFQTKLTQVQNNTTMTAAGAQQMHDAILSLGQDTGASLDQLADGYMHITNFGYNAADATQILTAATESAVSTGGNAADTAEILANVMHEFSINANDAGGAMDVLHLAAAEGNMTLEQFTNAAGPTLGIAANLGVSLTDVSAAMSALTRHGYDAAQAATQVKDVLTHIANPSKAAEAELAKLSKTTGIDLVADFSEAGLKAKGLNGVMMDMQKATGGNAEEMMKLIPALRGGLGAITLVGTGMADYTSILGDLADTYSGKTTPTADAFARTQQTLGGQLAILKDQVQVAAIELGEHFLPQLTGIVTWIRSSGIPGFQAFAAAAGPALAGAFNGMAAVVQQALGGNLTGAVHSVINSIASALPIITGALQQWGEALTGWLAPRIPILLGQLRVLAGQLGETLLSALSSGANALAGPVLSGLETLLAQIGTWLVTTGAPLLAERAKALGSAFLGWVEAVTPPLLAKLGDLMSALGTWISGTALPYLQANLPVWAQAFADWIPGATQQMVDNLGPLLDRLGTWLFDTGVPLLRAKLADWGHEFVAFVAPNIPPLLAEMAKLLVELTGWILLVALPQIILHLAEWGTELVAWVAPRIVPLLMELGKLLVALGGWIMDSAVPATIDAFKAMGLAIIQGIIAGLATLAQQLTDTITKALQSIRINVGPFHLDANGFHMDAPTMPSITVPGFASGTTNAPGGLALVGENGPELINLPRGSTVTPLTGMTQSGTRGGATGAAGGAAVNITISGNTMLASDSQTLRQLAQLLRPELDRLVRLMA